MSEQNPIFKRGAVVVGVLTGVLIGYVAARLTQPSRGPPVVARSDATSAPHTLSIPDSSLATMGIALEPIGAPASLGSEVQASAVVSPAPNGQAVVTARAPGTVTRLETMLGQNVAAGDVLAIVESRDAAAMAAERTTADSKVALARSNVARERSLFEQKVTPRQSLETAEADLAAAEAEAARARAAASAAGVTADGRSLALKSPIAGRITVANASLGAYVEPDTELFRIADPRFVVIEAAVPALDARRVEIGDGAEITTGSGAKLRATVNAVTPTLNERTRAATVTLSLADGEPTPAPGEFVLARISTRSGAENGFVIPDDAVQSLDGRNVVFVRTDGEFRVTPVVVSSRTGGRVAIASGLKAGDIVATTNAFLLKAEIGKGTDEEE